MLTLRKAAYLAVGGAVLMLMQRPALADETSSLLDTLLADHTITQAEYDRLKAQAAADMPAPTYPLVKVDGKVQFDFPLYATTNSKFTQLGDAALLRRALINVTGNLDPDWFYRVEVGDQNGAFTGTNIWLSYRHYAPFITTLGYQNATWGLDNLTADETRVFIEQDLANGVFAPAKQISWTASDHGQYWAAGASLLTNATSTSAAPASNSITNWGSATRLNFIPVNNNGTVLEVGVSAAAVNANSAAGAHTFAADAFGNTPELNTTKTQLIGSPAIPNVSGQQLGSLEAGAAFGPVLVTGEAMGDSIGRNSVVAGGNTHVKGYFSGWYVQGSWTLTGEARPYDAANSVWGGLTPSHPFNQGGPGAWELAVRYSSLDLDDARAAGATPAAPTVAGGIAVPGIQHDWTIGLNWYLIKNLRTELNYVRSTVTYELPSASGITANMAEARVQFLF